MASAVGFSYAQAAKGRSPAPSSSKAVSGLATPSSDTAQASGSWAEDTEGLDLSKTDCLAVREKSATNGHVKSSASAASSVTSPDAGNSSSSTKDDDTSSVQNASESTWDSKSQEFEPTAKAVDSEKSKGESEGSEETVKERKPSKPKLTEAKPPSVNIWQQRAQALQSKAPTAQPPQAASFSARAAPEATKRDQKSDSRKRNGAPSTQTQDGKNGAGRSERSNTTRQATDAPSDGQKKTTPHRQSPVAHAPAPTNEVAWPSMETAREEERKRALEKDDKGDNSHVQAPASKPVGKRDWNALPITPNVIFETTLPTRGATRGGRGGARGAANASGRTGTSGGRSQSLSNGDSSPVTKEQAEKADRDTMPPPAKPVRTSSEQWRDAPSFEPRGDNASAQSLSNGHSAAANGVEHETDVGASNSTAPKRQPSTKRTRSPRKQESGRRQSLSSRAGAEMTETGESQAARPSPTERRSDSRPYDNSANPPAYREGKGGKRGRGGHRGSGNAHFQPAHQNAAGFPAEFYGAGYAAPYSPQRGHFSQSSRGGHRSGNIRSQSIPMDNFGRAPAGYPGYPVQMIPAYGQMPEYYGGYPQAVAFQPGMEQMYLLPLISQQIEYYFSVDNLIKDTFFRKHMDSQGYVFLTFVADFKRLKTLTTEYDLIKYVCLQSINIELRTGEDGVDRLRKVGDWERWVLPVSERDPSAQNDGPSQVERPAAPQLRMFEQQPFPRGQPGAQFDRRFTEGPYAMNGMTPAFYPNGMEPSYEETVGSEELRGRQVKSPSLEHDASPFSLGADMGGEVDTFSTEAISTLTVVVRKTAPPPRAPFHTSNSRTFSDGSIDTRHIFEEGERPRSNGETAVNGGSPISDPRSQSPGQSTSSSPSANDAAVQLFWVKDREAPVDNLPADLGHELYTHLRQKALSQREVAATGTCPYDMDVLYQFWSHFLIRNFNAQMYAEFRHFAEQDARERHNNVGITNLTKFYSEAVASQIAIRERIARDYIDYVLSENINGERLALKQLRSAWRNGATNVKNRKKLSDLVDTNPAAAHLKAELDS